MKKKRALVLNQGPLLFWWRRGRVELPVQEGLPRISYKLSQLFCLTGLNSADRDLARPADSSFITLIGVGVVAPQLYVTQS
jgi:hypothetical protein